MALAGLPVFSVALSLGPVSPVVLAMVLPVMQVKAAFAAGVASLHWLYGLPLPGQL